MLIVNRVPNSILKLWSLSNCSNSCAFRRSLLKEFQISILGLGERDGDMDSATVFGLWEHCEHFTLFFGCNEPQERLGGVC